MFKMMMFGCLSFLLGGLVVGASCVVVGKEMVEATSRATNVTRKEAARLDRAHRFHPPSNGTLPEAGLDRFIKVRARIKEAITKDAKGPALSASSALSPVATLRTSLDARMKDRAQMILKVLDGAQMSPAEYRWYAQASYGTLLGAAATKQADAHALARKAQDALKSAGTSLGPLAASMNIDELTRNAPTLQPAGAALVEKHREALLDETLLVQDAVLLTLLGGSAALE